jgi:hypothetical protein
MSQKRMTDAQVFEFLENEHPGLFFRVKNLKVGESLVCEGFTINSDPHGNTKIVRPDWCNELETETGHC